MAVESFGQLSPPSSLRRPCSSWPTAQPRGGDEKRHRSTRRCRRTSTGTRACRHERPSSSDSTLASRSPTALTRGPRAPGLAAGPTWPRGHWARPVGRAHPRWHAGRHPCGAGSKSTTTRTARWATTTARSTMGWPTTWLFVDVGSPAARARSRKLVSSAPTCREASSARSNDTRKRGRAARMAMRRPGTMVEVDRDGRGPTRGSDDQQVDSSAALARMRGRTRSCTLALPTWLAAARPDS